MSDDEIIRPFIWTGFKPKKKQHLRIVRGQRKDYSPGLITCRGKCSESGDFWVWHDYVNNMYQCRACAHRRHWGTSQYRKW